MSSAADSPPTGGAPLLSPATPITPLYAASHAGRYERQRLIREIEKETGHRFISYVGGLESAIDRDDTLAFADLLHNLKANASLDLLLNTPGGDVDAAEKLVHMIRKRTGSALFRVIVPDFAKSAGTLMVLGADAVVMSDTSELGPIDPQITRSDVNGNRIWHSVLNYLEAYETHRDALAKDPANLTAQMMLSKLEPETIKLFEAARDRARACAEKFLKAWMFNKTGGNWSKTANDLMDNKRWLSHGQMICSDDAADIGLQVQYREQLDPEWDRFWRLYCLQRVAITPRQKIFESERVWLTLDGPSGDAGGHRSTIDHT